MGLNKIFKIGDRIKILRKNSNISQKDMAKMLDNMPVSTYSNYENNNREPSLDILIKISKILNVTVNELLGVETTFSKKIIQELEANVEILFNVNNVFEFLFKELKIPIEVLVNSYKNNINCSLGDQLKLFKYLYKIDNKNFMKFCIQNEKYILRNNELKNIYSQVIKNQADKILTAYNKDKKFEDVICNDREHLLFSFKCLLTNYSIDWTKFTDDELMEIINSGTMFDSFPKIIKTYYDFFKNRNEASKIKIDLPKRK